MKIIAAVLLLLAAPLAAQTIAPSQIKPGAENQVLKTTGGKAAWGNNSASVSSVFGRTGDVLPVTGDYNCSQITSAICSLPSLFNQTVEVDGAAKTQRAKLNFINGSAGTVSCVDNPVSLATDCTFTGGSSAGITYSIADVSGSRSVNTAYQNTTGSVMFVGGSVGTSGSGTGNILVAQGPTSFSLPFVDWANQATATVSSGDAGFSATVMPGYWYMVQTSGAVNGGVHHWTQITSSGSGGGGGFTAAGDLSGSSSSQTVVGLASVSFCTGFTPTNGQFIELTTGSSPNPCWTAAAGSGGGPNNFPGTTHQFVTAYNSGTQNLAAAQPVEADVVNLVSDLALKAPLASPTFTGVPAVPTAAPGTNTTQAASTAFVTAAVAGGGAFTPPTGTGFSHNTSGVPDPAARAVNVASADITGVQATANGGTGEAGTFTGIRKANSASADTAAVAADFPTLNQNTTGSAAKLTTPRAINGTNFDGTAPITVTAAPSGSAGGALAGSYPNPTIAGLGSTASVLVQTDGSGNLQASVNSYIDADGFLNLNYPGINIITSSLGHGAQLPGIYYLNTACPGSPAEVSANIEFDTGNSENLLDIGHQNKCSGSGTASVPDVSFITVSGYAHITPNTSPYNVTNSQLTSNIVTLTASNSFSAGQFALIFNLTSATLGPLLNGNVYTVLTASPTQFTFAFTHANVGSAAEVGNAQQMVDNQLDISNQGGGIINIGGLTTATPMMSFRSGLAANGIFFPLLGASSSGLLKSAPTTGLVSNATGLDVDGALTCADTSASGTAQSCTTSPNFTPAANSCVIYTTTTANTGTGLTLNVNGLGAKSVAKWLGTTTLAAGDVPANSPQMACYNGTVWNLSTIGNAPSGGGGSITFPQTVAGTVNSGGLVYANSGTQISVSPAGTAGQVVLWGGAGTAPGAQAIGTSGATIPLLNTAVTFSGAAAASAPSLNLTGSLFTGGSGTTTFPFVYINNGATAPTNFSTSGTEFGINAPSGFAGNFLDFRINGAASAFTVAANGATTGRSFSANGGVGQLTATGFAEGGALGIIGSKFTTSGCSVSASTGGSSGGTFTLGANSCTVVVTMGSGISTGSPNGWSCQAHDRTAPTVLIGGESSSTTTTASIIIPAGAGTTDVISFACIAF